MRHAAHDRVGSTLCGRMAGVSLGPAGRAQAEALARRLARESLSALYTSPLERARETAAPIAARMGLAPQISPAIQEIDYGDWTGRDFAALDGDAEWAHWNAARGTARVPGGECMAEAQSRAVAEIERLGAAHPGERIAVVSHADVIKAVLARYLGLDLDNLLRFDIAPASVSALALWEGDGKVLCMNETVAA
nr:histidine phosphatase family protein [Pararoseomonas baculiformis]